MRERGRSRSNSFSEHVMFSAHAESGHRYVEFSLKFLLISEYRVMEDTHSIVSQEMSDSIVHFFAIFDGLYFEISLKIQGHFGDFAANYCKEFLHAKFFKTLGEVSDIPKAIEQTFASIETEFLAEAGSNFSLKIH